MGACKSVKFLFSRDRIDNLSQMFQRQIAKMKAEAKKKFDDENLFLKYQVFIKYLLKINFKLKIARLRN